MRNLSVETLKILVFVLLMGVCCGVKAQTKSEKKMQKALAAEARNLEAQGWKVISPQGTLLDLLMTKQIMQDEKITDGSPIVKNKYIICSGTSTNQSLNSALKFAKTKAKSEITSKIVADVETMVVTSTSDSARDGESVASDARMGQVISKSSAVNMSKAIEIMTLFRENSSGIYEVMTYMAVENK